MRLGLLALLLFCACFQVKAAQGKDAPEADIRSNMGALEKLLALDVQARAASLFAARGNLDLAKAERDAAVRASGLFASEMRPYVRERLAKGAPDQRQFAASLLGDMGNTEDETALRAAASPQEASILVRDHAISSLVKIYRRMSPAGRFARLEACLPHLDDEASRDAACSILASFAPALEAFDFLPNQPQGKATLDDQQARRIVRIIKEGQPRLRCFAAEALAGIDTGIDLAMELMPLLVAEQSPEVRASLCHAIGGRVDGSAKMLSVAMGDADPRVRIEAAGSQARLRSDPAAIDILCREALEGEAPAGRRRALELLVFAARPESALALVRLLDDESWALRALTAKALGVMPGRSVTPKLGALLNDSDPRVAYEAAIAMSRQGVAGVDTRICEKLKQQAPAFCAYMAKALGEIGGKGVASDLAKLAAGSDAEAAAASVTALGRIAWRVQGQEAALALPNDFAAPLSIAIKDKRFCVSFAAAEALAQLTGLPFTTVPSKAFADWQRLQLEGRK